MSTVNKIIACEKKDSSYAKQMTKNSIVLADDYSDFEKEFGTEFYINDDIQGKIKLSEFSVDSGNPTEVINPLLNSLGLSNQTIFSVSIVDGSSIKIVFDNDTVSTYLSVVQDKNENGDLIIKLPEEVISRVINLLTQQGQGDRWKVIV